MYLGLRYKGSLNRGSTVFISNKFSDLFIWYRIKDVIDFFGIFNLHWNRMWKFWLIVAERFVKLLKDKLVQHAPVSLNKTRSYIFHISCKAFIKPKIIPPFHSDEVSKPLKKEIKTKIIALTFCCVSPLKSVKMPLQTTTYLSKGGCVGEEAIMYCRKDVVSQGRSLRKRFS